MLGIYIIGGEQAGASEPAGELMKGARSPLMPMDARNL